MNFTWNQAQAAGKHIASYIAGGVTFAVATHFLSPAQGTDLTTNIGLISDGLTKVLTGFAGILAVLTPIYTVWKAQHNASPQAQAASLEKAVPGTVIITSPEVAAATPNSPNVVSNTEVKAVNK